MLRKIGKILGVLTPFISLYSAYLMLFGWGYTYQKTHNNQETIVGYVTAFEYAVRNQAYEFFIHPLFFVTLSILGALAVIKDRLDLVWFLSGILLLYSILGAWSIGPVILPLALTLFFSGVLIAIHSKINR